MVIEYNARMNKNTLSTLKHALNGNEKVVGIVKKYVPNECLIVDLGNNIEGKLNIKDFENTENTSVTSMISKVGSKIVCYVEDITPDTVLLNRARVQKEYIENYLSKLEPGTIFDTNIISIAPFGLFIDMGYGILGLLPLNDISIARLSSINGVFNVGDALKVIYTGKGDSGYIVSHKELLGTWEENVADFTEGEVIQGIVRDVKPYGAFIEISPNLTGLADIQEGMEVKVGDSVTVLFKSSNKEKQKVKLYIVKHSNMPYKLEYRYKINEGILKEWSYTPIGSRKEVKTIFDGIIKNLREGV